MSFSSRDLFIYEYMSMASNCILTNICVIRPLEYSDTTGENESRDVRHKRAFHWHFTRIRQQ